MTWEQSYRYFESLPVVITYTDGTTQDHQRHGGITPGDGETVCQKSRIFDELRPLDEVASVTVGDIVLPVSADNRPSPGRAYTPIKRSYRARPFPCVIIEAAITDRRNPYDDPRRSGPHRHR